MEDREQELVKQKMQIEDLKSNFKQTYNNFYDTLDHIPIPKDPKSSRTPRTSHPSRSPSPNTKSTHNVYNKNNSTLDKSNLSKDKDISKSKNNKQNARTHPDNNASPSSITIKMTKAYENLIVPEDKYSPGKNN